MTTKLVNAPKSVLAAARRELLDPAAEPTIKWVRASKRKRSAAKTQTIKGRFMVQKHFPARLSVERVAGWLDCSEANIRDIECAKMVKGERRRLTPEQAEVLSIQMGVSLKCLLDNDPSKPVIGWDGRPFSQWHFDDRQKEIARGGAKPQTVRDAVCVRNSLVECCGMLAALILRGLRRGNPDIVAHKVKGAMARLYRQTAPGEGSSELVELVDMALNHDYPSLTRPDVGRLFQEFDSRSTAILRERNPEVPITYAQVRETRRQQKEQERIRLVQAVKADPYIDADTRAHILSTLKPKPAKRRSGDRALDSPPEARQTLPRRTLGTFRPL
jgi:hypothetical protein